MNRKIRLLEVNVPQAKIVCPEGKSIDNDLILFEDITKVPLPNSPSRMKALFLALCTSGHAQYTVDTKMHEVSAGDVIIISEEQVVADYKLSDNCKGIALIMSYNFFQNIVSGIHELSPLFLFARTHPVFHLDDNQTKALENDIEHIKEKIADVGHRFRRELVVTMLKALIIDMSNIIYQFQQVGDEMQTRAEVIFRDFIQAVEKNYRTERRVSWYAQQLCITSKYLSETVRTVSRRTPSDWIDSYVTRELRVMLRNSTMSIKQIADELNFANQSFLGKYFKEHVGMSPSKFRKS
ncbi:AraC family transcriptional regulator [Prevotella scopos JCM 17725]|jgi:putative araC-type transcription regulator|uniref:AraC-type DNA-binding protein n=1 Tax=Prevotella scopos JCM 17725 TaxID=1236518 RepID=A0AAX2F1W7_9BACT|nr:helix-turn-helix domain-containing protein [Prevotella scopos]ANR72051.1 AraC family transcriptional regulator [Prevotella scopos JCM 17725]QUB45757.1 AraC family transcriptional regulator [Prevotella scopos JCM 17725]SHF65366.1 AraC-type DNA-binding protein [Prevotella scopos JCM 17725]